MKSKTHQTMIVLLSPLLFSMSLIPLVSAEHLDISKIVGEKYSLQVDDQTFVIYYGYGGSLEMDVTKRIVGDPEVISMSINSDHKSLEINLKETSGTHAMWIRLPPEFLSAEGGKFKVMIDSVEKGYDLTNYPDDVAVGYILPEGSKHVEIIGTHIIPEFGQLSLVVFALSLFSVLYILKNKNRELKCR